MTKRIVLTVFSATMLMAQSEIRPDLAGLVYPALPLSARIQGSVKFTVLSNEITLVSGHPLLIEAAKHNLEKWVGTAAGECLSADYDFSLRNDLPLPPVKTTIVEAPIGNSFERFFLRLLRRPVTRKTRQYVYPPPFQKVEYLIKPAENGCAIVEIDVQSGSSYVQW